MWLLTKPQLSDPPVVNFSVPRANGQTGRFVTHDDDDWFVFRAQDNHVRFALRLLNVSPARIDGDIVVCDQPIRATSNLQPFIALPLAPSRARAFGLENVAQYPAPDATDGESGCRTDGARPHGWPFERSSDLAVLNSSLLVVARGNDGLRVLDVSQVETGTLAERAHLPAAPGDDYNDVAAISESVIAVASRRNGLMIVDLAAPESPALIEGSLPLDAPRDGHNVFVADDNVFLAQAPASGRGALVAVDVRDPSSPKTRWRTPLAAGHDAHDVFVAGQTAYVSSLRGGMYTFDVANGEQLARISVPNAHSVALLPVHGSQSRLLLTEETVAGALRLLAFPEADLTKMATRPLTQTWNSDASVEGVSTLVESAATPHKLQCVSDRCFIAFYQLGLRVLDFTSGDEALAAPSLQASFPSWSPSPLGELNWLQGATGVAVDLPWVYVLDTCAGVLALRSEQPGFSE